LSPLHHAGLYTYEVTTAAGEGLSESVDPLVLLPGMNCSAQLWSGLDRGGWPPLITTELTEATLQGQVGRLLDELPRRFAIGGLSLGGIVAMALTRTAPERISSLILMSTNPYAPTRTQRTDWRAWRDALDAGRTARELQSEWLPQLLSEPARGRKDVVALTLDMAEEIGEVHLANQLAMQASRVDERRFLRDVRCPTLIISARQDALCSVAKHVEMKHLIGSSVLAILENSGHLSPLEAPRQITEHFARWRYSQVVRS
jgi:pimeloyl-ACP methyl ester carboxylesterase